MFFDNMKLQIKYFRWDSRRLVDVFSLSILEIWSLKLLCECLFTTFLVSGTFIIDLRVAVLLLSFCSISIFHGHSSTERSWSSFNWKLWCGTAITAVIRIVLLTTNSVLGGTGWTGSTHHDLLHNCWTGNFSWHVGDVYWWTVVRATRSCTRPVMQWGWLVSHFFKHIVSPLTTFWSDRFPDFGCMTTL